MAAKNVPTSHIVTKGFYYGYVVVAAALVIMLASYGTFYAYGVFFKPMLNSLGWTRTMTSGAFSLSLVIHGILGVLMGVLTDRLGSRLVITICGIFLGLGYLLMSQIEDLWQLYLFYGMIIGIGMSGVWVPLMSTVARWFAKRRTMMSGIVLSGTGVGTLIVPPMANWLISIYDWRISFIIIGLIVLLVIILAAQFLRRDPTRMAQVHFANKKEEEQLSETEAAGYSLKKAAYTRQFWQVWGMFLCFGICMFAIMVHIVPHAIELGISADNAANILGAMGITVIIGRVALGSAADRIGDRNSFIIGFILMFISFLWIIQATQIWMFYLFAAIFGFAHGGMGSSESPLVAGLFGLKSHGLILGVITLGFTFGAAVGPVLAGYVFDITSSYQMSFLVCAAVATIGLLLALTLTTSKTKNKGVTRWD